MCNLSSPSRDQTFIPWIGRQIVNHRTSRGLHLAGLKLTFFSKQHIYLSQFPGVSFWITPYCFFFSWFEFQRLLSALTLSLKKFLALNGRPELWSVFISKLDSLVLGEEKCKLKVRWVEKVKRFCRLTDYTAKYYIAAALGARESKACSLDEDHNLVPLPYLSPSSNQEVIILL